MRNKTPLRPPDDQHGSLSSGQTRSGGNRTDVGAPAGVGGSAGRADRFARAEAAFLSTPGILNHLQTTGRLDAFLDGYHPDSAVADLLLEDADGRKVKIALDNLKDTRRVALEREAFQRLANEKRREFVEGVDVLFAAGAGLAASLRSTERAIALARSEAQRIELAHAELIRRCDALASVLNAGKLPADRLASARGIAEALAAPGVIEHLDQPTLSRINRFCTAPVAAGSTEFLIPILPVLSRQPGGIDTFMELGRRFRQQGVSCEAFWGFAEPLLQERAAHRTAEALAKRHEAALGYLFEVAVNDLTVGARTRVGALANRLAVGLNPLMTAENGKAAAITAIGRCLEAELVGPAKKVLAALSDSSDYLPLTGQHHSAEVIERVSRIASARLHEARGNYLLARSETNDLALSFRMMCSQPMNNIADYDTALVKEALVEVVQLRIDMQLAEQRPTQLAATADGRSL